MKYHIQNYLKRFLIYMILIFSLIGCISNYWTSRDADTKFRLARESLIIGMGIDEVHKTIDSNALEYRCDSVGSNVPVEYQNIREYYIFGNSRSEHILLLRYISENQEIILTEIAVIPERSWLPSEDAYCEQVSVQSE
jgi:hypothetical protein